MILSTELSYPISGEFLFKQLLLIYFCSCRTMVRDFIKIHDQFAFEIKLEFPVGEGRKKKDRFNFEMFLFLPYGLDVHKHNFQSKDFYRSLKTNIRLTSPQYKLEELLNGKNAPLASLTSSIERSKKYPSDQNIQLSKQQLKKYCSIFDSAIRQAIERINRSKKMESRSKLVNVFILQIELLREGYHKLPAILIGDVSLEDLLREYRFADEYQSLLIETHVFALMRYLQNKKEDHKADLANLHQLAEQEMDFRDAQDYPSVSKPKHSNEDVLHRKSRLKKYIESNLFLNTYTRQEGLVTAQILFSIAAGLAMVFATAVAFASQMIYGTLTIPFFIALVIGYMFKDRIKELVRVYLDKKRKKVHADFKTIIYDQHKKKIGHLKESFHFEQKTHLPEDVKNARELMRITEMGEIGSGDNILGYKNKTILLNSKIQKKEFSGITQILRLNISDFTRKMDDPEKEVFVRTKKGIKRMLADRVYHLNMILRYGDSKTKEIKCYKIKASRNGIKKIEHQRVSE